MQAALRIGEARGVLLAEAARFGVEVHQFAPARVKRCVTGRGAASKGSVAAMVGQLVRLGRGLAESLPADATDAVAVALTRVEQRAFPPCCSCLPICELDASWRTRMLGWPISFSVGRCNLSADHF